MLTSSESECEEFFDAAEVVPKKSFEGELLKSQRKDATARSFKAPDVPVRLHASPLSSKHLWRSSTAYPLEFSSLHYPLSLKVTSSLPTLHLQESSRPDHSLLSLTDEGKLVKEHESIDNMVSPKEFPAKYDRHSSTSSAGKFQTEDTGSVCSESLFDSLNTVEEAEPPSFHHRGRRAQQRNKKGNQVDDDEASTFPSSPCESQSSSVDAIFPSINTSAPFRVVEVDATSAYSTTFSQDFHKGSKTGSTGKNEASEMELVGQHVAFICTKKSETSKEGLLALSPEPDIIASTKSNSLPRCCPAPITVGVPSVEKESPNSPVHPAVAETLLSDFHKEMLVTEATVASNSNQSCKSDVLPPVTDSMAAPVAPPRRNRKRQDPMIDEDSVSTASGSSLPAPYLSIPLHDSDAISNSLDIQAAVRGDYIVQPLDLEQSRAPRPTEMDLTRIESAGDSTSQASTPETTRSFVSRSLKSPEEQKYSGVSSSTTTAKESLTSSSVAQDSSVKQSKIQVESGKELTDEEILSQVTLLNLDTGERIPLSKAEECLPVALNPLHTHIMRLTSEYRGANVQDDHESDDDSIIDTNVRILPEIDTVAVRKKTSQIKKFFGKKVESAVSKARSLAQEVSQRGSEKDVFEDDAPTQHVMQYVKIKTSHSHKGPIEFDNLMYVQELKGEHTGPVWCMKFSACGRLLATAGQDHVLRVWVVKQAFNYFLDIRTKWNADVKSSPTPSQESLVSQQSSHSSEDIGTLDPCDDGLAPFMPKPFCVYSGHTADVLDLSWSKNYFMLTSSMDKTVRLWHISRKECLCIFKHVDFVTAIAFHPRDDRYFISGSLDGKLRLWSIPDKQVVMWNEVEGHPKLITAANFCQNGAFTVVGTYNGRCIFYKTEELKYYTQIHVKSTRGKNARGGRKITGIEPLPDENKLMITSNDSRIRLYNLGVLNVCCKYKGCTNFSSQIRAGFSHDGKYIVCGSENQCIYIWKTNHDYSKFSSARKDRNVYWEGVKAHSAVVTCVIFSPRPEHVFNFIEQQEAVKKEKGQESGNLKDGSPINKDSMTSNKGYVLVSADFNGCIKIFLKKEKPKHSSLPASALA